MTQSVWPSKTRIRKRIWIDGVHASGIQILEPKPCNRSQDQTSYKPTSNVKTNCGVCVCDVAKFHPWYARTFSTNHKVTQSKPEHQAFKKKLWRGRIQSFNIIPKPPGPSCGSCYLFRRFVRGTGRNWEKFSNDPHGSRGSRHPVGFVVDISLKWTSSRKKFPNTNLDWCDIAGLIGISMDFYNYDLWCVALEQTSNKKRLIQ